MPSAPKSNEGISTARPASLLLHGTWDRSRTSLDRSLILIAIVIVVVTASLSFFMARGTLERLQDERRARHAAAIDAFGAALNAQLSAGTRLLRHVARQPEKLPLVFEDGVVAESVVGTFHFDGELRCLARTTEAADESLESEIVALAARAREDARVHVVERAADGRGYLAVLQRVHAAGRGEESLILLFDAHALIETFLPRAPELSITRITTESGEGLFERRDARAIDAGRTSEFAIRLDPQTRAFVECDTGPELELPLGPVAWGLAMLAVAASVLLSLRSSSASWSRTPQSNASISSRRSKIRARARASSTHRGARSTQTPRAARSSRASMRASLT